MLDQRRRRWNNIVQMLWPNVIPRRGHRSKVTTPSYKQYLLSEHKTISDFVLCFPYYVRYRLLLFCFFRRGGARLGDAGYWEEDHVCGPGVLGSDQCGGWIPCRGHRSKVTKAYYKQYLHSKHKTFVQCWTNVGDVGTILYKCYDQMLYPAEDTDQK